MAEFYPSKVDVAGSTPVILFCVGKCHLCTSEDLYGHRVLDPSVEKKVQVLHYAFRSLNSAARVSPLHGGSHWFESSRVHCRFSSMAEQCFCKA